jgi:hypothetical protein
MKEEGRRKKEEVLICGLRLQLKMDTLNEGRRKKEEGRGFDMWIETPTQNFQLGDNNE